jgi:CDP-diacylglycerol--glycerol-3-phosphate 3-phosphatidyltransferase
MVIIILLRDFIITILRAYADYKGSSFPTSNYAKWKTFIQMAFLYYLLLIYTAINSPLVFDGNEKIFAVLMDRNFIYYMMFFITVITFHSGVTYIIKNRHLILRLFRYET